MFTIGQLKITINIIEAVLFLSNILSLDLRTHMNLCNFRITIINIFKSKLTLFLL